MTHNHEFDSQKDAALVLHVYRGKYTVAQDKDGRLKALRYGEPWRDLTGDNLVFRLAQELAEARKLLQRTRPFVAELMPDLGDHQCGHPDAVCDGECVDAANTSRLLCDIDLALKQGEQH